MSNKEIKRNTLGNLASMIMHLNGEEMLKVMRRRLLNTVKFMRVCAYKVFGVAYYHPSLVYRRNYKQLIKVKQNYYGILPEQDNEARTKVAVVLHRGDSWPSSSAFIRLISPLSSPLIQGSFVFKTYPENTTRLEEGTKICIVQRTAVDNLNDARLLVQNLRNSGIKLVVDTDDAFGSIDTDHPEYETHKTKILAKNFLLESSDRVWVSTEVLAKTLGLKVRKKTIIIENTLDSRVWRTLSKATDRKIRNTAPFKILYMGTATHDGDLAMILPALNHIAEKHPRSFELTVVGVSLDTPDYSWLNRLDQKNSLYPIFVSWFIKTAPNYDIGISPLVDTPFNNSKSDIKALDYLAAGIIPMVSDLEPYKNKKLDELIIRVKNNQQSWEEALLRIIESRENFRAESTVIIDQARDYINSRRNLDVAAKAIYKELNKLM